MIRKCVVGLCHFVRVRAVAAVAVVAVFLGGLFGGAAPLLGACALALTVGFVWSSSAIAQVVVPADLDPETLVNAGLTAVSPIYAIMLVVVIALAIAGGVIGFFWGAGRRGGKGRG